MPILSYICEILLANHQARSHEGSTTFSDDVRTLCRVTLRATVRRPWSPIQGMFNSRRIEKSNFLSPFVTHPSPTHLIKQLIKKESLFCRHVCTIAESINWLAKQTRRFVAGSLESMGVAITLSINTLKQLIIALTNIPLQSPGPHFLHAAFFYERARDVCLVSAPGNFFFSWRSPRTSWLAFSQVPWVEESCSASLSVGSLALSHLCPSLLPSSPYPFPTAIMRYVNDM